jgi:hypothetical protein
MVVVYRDLFIAVRTLGGDNESVMAEVLHGLASFVACDRRRLV